MRVLIVSQYFWPEHFPINNLVAALVEKGHRVEVLTGIPNYPSGRFYDGYGAFRNSRQHYLGAKIMRVPLIPRGKGGGFRLALNYFSFAFLASILSPFLCRGRFDLIFVYEPSPITVALPAIFLKKIRSAPLVLWVQDLWPESLSATGSVRSPFLLKAVKKLVRFIYHQCDLILVQSKGFVSSIRDFGVDPDKIVYFPNTAEEFYRPVDLEKHAGERKEIPAGFIVMFAGNIGAAQDFPTIISAAEKLKDQKDIHWVIIGDGRMRVWGQNEIASRNLSQRFTFLGRRPAESMPRYFALADALLVTLRKDEIFEKTIPSKVQPYMACGRPIIASLAGEGARIIEEAQAGFSCPAQDPSGLAELVLKMYHMSQAQRNQTGLNARKYFDDNFSREKLVNQLNGIFNKMMGAAI